MRHTHARIAAVTGLGLLALAAAGCSGSDRTASDLERRAVAQEQARIRRERREDPPAAPPLIPFEVGQRAGLGPWQLSIDGYETGPVITVRATLTNTRGTAVAAPAPETFELRDAGAPSNAPAVVIAPSGIDGLPPTVEGRVPTPITIRFTPSAPLAVPVLRWNGESIGSFDALFRIGDPAPTAE